MIRNAILHIALLVILCSCGGNSGRDRKFDRIDTMTDTEPGKALEMLDSIDYGSLTERERHRHDLLTIKARDKAYIRHTSDSLILDVIGYYESHRDKKLYPMALYYGGRVYSDMGDYPTALQYFQNAIDIIPDDKENLDFRGIVLSQTGRLLSTLRLYSEAVPYIKESIHISQIMNDSVGLSYDYRLLGVIYTDLKDYPAAEAAMQEASRFCHNLSDEYKACIIADLAYIKYKNGEVDSALKLIRPLPPLVHTQRNRVLASAAEIYLKAGINDTAYIYAYQLAKGAEGLNKKIGYQLLLSPELSMYTPQDSVPGYALRLKLIIEEYLNTHEAQEALMQNALYNYAIHERERLKAEKSKNIFLWLLVLFAFFAFAFAIIILILRIRKTNVKLKLHEASDKIDRLNKQLEAIANKRNPQEITEEQKNEIYELRKRTEAKVEAMCQGGQKSTMPSALINSNEYRILQEHINQNKVIPEIDNFWNELEQAVNDCSPRFSYNLQLLIGELNRTELHLALLIKCGITPTQATIIFGKEKGTLSYHRKELGSKCLNRKTSAKLVDYIIHSL